jgi:hypothetical protein
MARGWWLVPGLIASILLGLGASLSPAAVGPAIAGSARLRITGLLPALMPPNGPNFYNANPQISTGCCSIQNRVPNVDPLRKRPEGATI